MNEENKKDENYMFPPAVLTKDTLLESLKDKDIRKAILQIIIDEIGDEPGTIKYLRENVGLV